MIDKPFGAYAPHARLRLARRVAAGLGPSRAGRLAASALRTLSGARRSGPYDVEALGARLRLYPADNLADKRALLTPHLFDAPERAFLAARIAAGAGRFRFVDVGANSGLYALFARAAAAQSGRAFEALAIEADPAMAARLAFNIAASGAQGEVRVAQAAVGAARRTVRLLIDPAQRGRTQVAGGADAPPAGGVAVEAHPLSDLLAHHGMEAPDALKIDIEGGELHALGPYFETTPRAALPRAIIAELAHDADGALEALLARNGYARLLRTRLNGAFAREDQ